MPTSLMRMSEPSWANIEHFTSSEFPRPLLMAKLLIHRLDSARSRAGVPFLITSSFREDSETHSDGLAVDIACDSSSTRITILHALILSDFRRIGLYDRHIHVDVADMVLGWRPSLWLGLSR